MKAHIGVHTKSVLTHSLKTRPANEHNFNQVGIESMTRKCLSSLTRDIRDLKAVASFI